MPNWIRDHTWLLEPPNREALLAMSPDDPVRQRTVIQRANWLVQAVDNPAFQETRDITDLEWVPK